MRREMVPLSVSLRLNAVMRDADVWRVMQRLVDDTVTFREAEQCSKLVFRRVCGKIKLQPDALKPHRGIFGNPECASKIQITFRSNSSLTNLDA